MTKVTMNKVREYEPKATYFILQEKIIFKMNSLGFCLFVFIFIFSFNLNVANKINVIISLRSNDVQSINKIAKKKRRTSIDQLQRLVTHKKKINKNEMKNPHESRAPTS